MAVWQRAVSSGLMELWYSSWLLCEPLMPVVSVGELCGECTPVAPVGGLHGGCTDARCVPSILLRCASEILAPAGGLRGECTDARYASSILLRCESVILPDENEIGGSILGGVVEREGGYWIGCCGAGGTKDTGCCLRGRFFVAFGSSIETAFTPEARDPMEGRGCCRFGWDRCLGGRALGRYRTRGCRMRGCRIRPTLLILIRVTLFSLVLNHRL